MHRWTLGALATTLFFLTIVLAAALSPMASDTWWQLRAGADMWASGRVLLTDTYVTHRSRRLLAQPRMAVAGDLLRGLSPWRPGAAQPVRGRADRDGVDDHVESGRRTGVAAARDPSPCPGPGQRTLGAASARVLAALSTARRVADPAAPVLLVDPGLFFVWANCHGGVLLGLVVSAAALGAALFHEPPASRASTLKIAGLAFAGCVAAVSLTPLGLSFWVEIPRSLARIRQYPLDEWLAPRLSELPLAPFWVLAAVFCVLLIVNRRRVSTRQTAILCLPALVLLPMALSAVRNVGPFLMFAAPAICGLLPERAFAALNRPEQKNRPALNLGLAAVATLMAVVAIGYAYRFQVDHLKWTPLPEASLRALRQCPDNL